MENDKDWNEYIKKIIKEEIQIDPKNEDFIKNYYSGFDIFDYQQQRLKRELYEGLISSQPISQVFTSFNLKFAPKLKLTLTKFKSLNVIFYNFSDTNHLYKDVKKLMNNLGWFLAQSFYEDKKLNKRIPATFKKIIDKNPETAFLIFEPKFDMELDHKRLPKNLYHITLLKHQNKIKKQGLTPRAKNKKSYHPKRIYFLTDKNNYKIFAKKLYPKEKKFLLIEIKTKDLNDIRLFKDINTENGIFTLENVHPNLLNITKFQI